MSIQSPGHRKEDRSFFGRLLYLADRFRPVVWVAIGLLLAIGFDFQTPKQLIAENREATQAVADTVRQVRDSLDARITDVEARVVAVEEVIRGLGRVQCRKDKDASLYAGIPCDELQAQLYQPRMRLRRAP